MRFGIWSGTVLVGLASCWAQKYQQNAVGRDYPSDAENSAFIGSTLVGSVSVVDSPVLGYSAAIRSEAVLKLTDGFNALGRNAPTLRRSMSANDAEAFDSVMLDLVSALLALPSISRRESHRSAISPRDARPDRIPQIQPDLEGLDKFFGRLSAASSSAVGRKMFEHARKNVRKMLAALPDTLPTMKVKAASQY